MGDRIYSIDDTLKPDLAIREWEIVDSTRSYYIIQPRGIPNKTAELVSRHVRKDDVTNAHDPAKFYWAKRQAIELEIKRSERQIRIASRTIRDEKNNIFFLEQLRSRLPHYE